MTVNSSEEAALLNFLLELYQEKIPFNRVLGISISSLSFERAMITFKMKSEFVGNFMQNTLHGGVISAVLDATGGLIASAGLIQKRKDLSGGEIMKLFAMVGTIDLRVDYLRPGRGNHFLSTATIMRTGKKVAVTRMELENDRHLLIAVGTGTYLVG